MTQMTNKWIEIALYDHWSDQPHGIARATQNLFLASLSDPQYKYFYYCLVRQEFVVPEDIQYFVDIAQGRTAYANDRLPKAVPFETCIGTGDRVMITGAGWGLKDYLEQLRAIKTKSTARLACIIYDIIAVHSPQFFLGDFAALVAGFQRQIVALADHVACISRHTESDVRTHLIRQGSQTTSVFAMGADFPATPQTVRQPPQSHASHSTSRPYILSVGTIEARKNHLLLYYLMRKLVLTYGDDVPDLIIVGKVGWLSNDAIEFMRRDPLVKEHIHILNSVNDAELEDLYQSCLFTIYPSFYEGYGLPVLESLGRGKVCVCSNTSSMQEITPFPELTFDPYDPMNAFGIVSRLVRSKDELAGYERSLRERNFNLSWADSFEALSSWLELSA
jgi:glycosyltransferase involved in cell wall biosynthesis